MLFCTHPVEALSTKAIAVGGKGTGLEIFDSNGGSLIVKLI